MRKFEEGREEADKKMVMLLPQELLIEILSRLSIKTLLRCSCVCRAWRTLIQDPSFAHLQLTNSKQIPYNVTLNFLVPKSPHPEVLHNFWGAKSRHLELLHHSATSTTSCNGLLCFTTSLRNLCVANPITGECVFLPQSSFESDYTCTDSIHFGIGFDSTTREYKVVRIFTKRGRSQDEAEICKLEGSSMSWRRMGKIPYSILSWGRPDDAGLFVDGALHWWMDADHRAIASMDMRTQKFCNVERPPGTADIDAFFQMVEWNGCLGVIEYDPNDLGCNIWLLKDYPPKEEGKMMSWTKALHVDWNNLNLRFRIPCPRKKGEILVLTNRGNVDCRFSLGSYDLKEKKFTTYEEKEYEVSLSYYQRLSYVPSLVKIGRSKNMRI